THPSEEYEDHQRPETVDSDCVGWLRWGEIDPQAGAEDQQLGSDGPDHGIPQSEADTWTAGPERKGGGMDDEIRDPVHEEEEAQKGRGGWIAASHEVADHNQRRPGQCG